MFGDRLQTQLTLTIGQAAFTITSGGLRRFDIDVFPWGVSADITFRVDCSQEPDPIFDTFITLSPITATFSLCRDIEGETPDESQQLKIMGVVVDKSVTETIGETMDGQPVVERIYDIHVIDAGRAYWTEHRPVELYTASTLADVLDLHKPTGVTVTYDWAALQTKQDVICLILHGDREPTFYDFIVWYVTENQGVLEFDARTGSYRIGEKKTKGSSASELTLLQVDKMRLTFPEPPRFSGRVLNPFTLATVTRVLTNDQAITNVRRDVLEHTPIGSIIDQRASVEAKRFRTRPHGIEVIFKLCPDEICQPGDLFEIADDFSSKLYPSGTKYRTVRLRVSAAHPDGPKPDTAETVSVYEGEITLDGEKSTSTVAWLPPFKDPRTTVRLEGTIVSAGGSDADRSWAAMENDDNSLWMYKIDVPLFNKTIPVPFAPTFTSGHFFFPGYKNQRVLVDVAWDRATLAGFIDWADEGRLPSNTQGSQIVLGFQSTNGTVIKHIYDEAKPALSIVRKADGETVTFSMTDGAVRLALEEASVPSTTIPVYDVSPQVAAAKDAVTSEVGGGVTEVTSAFQASTSKVSSRIDDTTAAVDDEVSNTTRELNNSIGETKTELRGMTADASASVMIVSGSLTSQKAKVNSALDSMDAARTPLRDLSQKLSVTQAQGKIKTDTAENDIKAIGADASKPIDDALTGTAALESKSAAEMARLRGRLDDLGPNASQGPFKDVTVLSGDIDSAKQSVASVSSGIDDDVAQANSEVGEQWAPNYALLDTRQNGVNAAYDNAIATSMSRQQAMYTALDAKAKASASAAQRAAQLRPRIDAIRSGAPAALNPTKQRLTGTLTGLRTTFDTQRKQVENSVTTAASQSKQTVATLKTSVDAQNKALTQLSASLSAAATTKKATLSASIANTEATSKASVAAIKTSGQTAKTTLSTAITTSQTSLLVGLAAPRGIMTALNASVGSPLKVGMAAVDTAEAAARTAMNAALASLEATAGTAMTSMSALIASFESIVEGGIGSLDEVTSLLTSLRDQIMTPLDALGDLLTDIETAFQTAATMLTAFIDTAEAALDAIPAVGLPAAVVNPTMSAISAALDAVLPLIATATSTASTQLGTIANTLLTQVGTAETAAMQGITTFSTSITTQIQALLPPIKTQLAGVQTQIDAAVATVTSALSSAADAAVKSIQATVTSTTASSNTTASTGTSTLSSAQSSFDSSMQTVNQSITSGKSTLTTQAQSLATPITQQTVAAQTSLTSSVATIDASVDTALADLATQLATGRTPIDAQLATIKTNAEAVRPTLKTSLDAAVKAGAPTATQAQGTIPTQASLDSQFAATWQGYASQLDALDASIAAL